MLYSTRQARWPFAHAEMPETICLLYAGGKDIICSIEKQQVFFNKGVGGSS